MSSFQCRLPVERLVTRPLAWGLRRSRFWLIAGLALCLAAPAQAHLEVLPMVVDAGEYEVLVLRVYHGCGDHPTTGITLKAPADVYQLRPMAKAGWQISVQKGDYPSPITIYGETLRSGIVQIDWREGIVPAEFMDQFAFSAFFSEVPGKKVRLEIQQHCEGLEAPETSTIELGVRDPAGGEAQSRAPKPTKPTNSEGSGKESVEPSGLALFLGASGSLLGLIALLRSFRR